MTRHLRGICWSTKRPSQNSTKNPTRNFWPNVACIFFYLCSAFFLRSVSTDDSMWYFWVGDHNVVRDTNLHRGIQKVVKVHLLLLRWLLCSFCRGLIGFAVFQERGSFRCGQWNFTFTQRACTLRRLTDSIGSFSSGKLPISLPLYPSLEWPF